MTRKYKNDRVDWKLVFSLKNFLHLLAGTGLSKTVNSGGGSATS